MNANETNQREFQKNKTGVPGEEKQNCGLSSLKILLNLMDSRATDAKAQRNEYLYHSSSGDSVSMRMFTCSAICAEAPAFLKKYSVGLDHFHDAVFLQLNSSKSAAGKEISPANQQWSRFLSPTRALKKTRASLRAFGMKYLGRIRQLEKWSNREKKHFLMPFGFLNYHLVEVRD